MKDEVQRGVPLTVPPISAQILQRLPGFEDFNPLTEVLRMLRCGFGLKDAPRLWNKLLRKVLQDLGLSALQSDPQLFVWHVASGSTQLARQRGAQGVGGPKRRVLVLSLSLIHI